jgi:uncharacterized membrane protein
VEAVLLFLGLIASIIGSVMIIGAAFRTSLLWGFSSLFIPFIVFFFIAEHWKQSRDGVFWLLVGVGFIGAAIMLRPETWG